MVPALIRLRRPALSKFTGVARQRPQSQCYTISPELNAPTTMDYISTRGQTAPMSFKDAVLTGLAPDGGLLIPSEIPDVRTRLGDWRRLNYVDLATEILSLFATDIDRDTLAGIVKRSYATFSHPDIAPVVPVGDVHIMELFHGPTLAFKDVALQLLGNLFELVLAERDTRMSILGATSGDTGSAGIAAVRGRDRINICVLYPHQRTSRLQELQMTTVDEANVHCLSVEGSFDDCQGMMKSIFSDLAFKERFHLGAINSVNCARLLAQVVYYFFAWTQVATNEEPVAFSVPTGNFGDIFAGYLAHRMGLPVERLILATNENDILSVFFETGTYARGDVHRTLSPSMDIQVASNFERYLYYRLDGDAERLQGFMKTFAAEGRASLGTDGPVSSLFVADAVDRGRTLETIGELYRDHRYLLDPHTAVGVAAARPFTDLTPVVCLATAHPAKFPDAIEQAVGADIARHPTLDALSGLAEHKRVVPADEAAVRRYIETHCA
ncbi:MAG: threonine synthase [Pseudomonadota bacterium]